MTRQVDFELLDEPVELPLQKGPGPVDEVRDMRRPAGLAENPFIDPLVLGIHEMRFRDQQALLRIAVQLTRKPEARVTGLLEEPSRIFEKSILPVPSGM